jgi:hypothetical protein
MDASNFDHLVRSWVETRSRRPLLGVLAGGAASMVGLTETSGKRKKKRKVTLCHNGQTIIVPKKKKGRYLRQGATAGKCAATCVRQCSRKSCGPDGCGGSCGNCPGDKTCQDGRCACPDGTLDCGVNDICVPIDSQCCIDEQCISTPGQRCLRGKCVVWQGTCSAGANSCASEVGCNATPGCACYVTTEGETRCGSGAGIDPPCNVCTSSADCEEEFPDIPGVFCILKGDEPGCCPGSCARPCPTF